MSLGGRAVGWPAHEVAALNADTRIAGKAGRGDLWGTGQRSWKRLRKAVGVGADSKPCASAAPIIDW